MKDLSRLPIDVIYIILSYIKSSPIKPRLRNPKFGGDSFQFMDQIKKRDNRFSILQNNIRPIAFSKSQSIYERTYIYESNVVIMYRNSPRGYSIKVSGAMKDISRNDDTHAISKPKYIVRGKIEAFEYYHGLWWTKLRTHFENDPRRTLAN